MTSLKKIMYRPAFNSFFDDVFSRSVFEHQPLTNIRETQAGFDLEILAPGRKKEDFHIDLHEQTLTISAQTEATEQTETGKWTRREFSLSQWKRSFSLSKDSIDTENIIARYENGILYLHLPKFEAKKQEIKRRIELS